MAGQPITAAAETVARDGLAGAVGYGVQDLGTAATRPVASTAPEPQEIGGHQLPSGGAAEPVPPVPVSDDLDPEGRWLNPYGFTLEGAVCGAQPYTAPADFCDFEDQSRAREWGEANALLASLPDQHPFVVGAGVKCSTLGSPTEEAPWREAARRSLELSQWSQVANELWTGHQARESGWTQNRWLASPDATVLADGDPVDLVEAIAALEDAFGGASYGAVQLIHVPRKLSAYLDHASIISTSPGSGRLWTANDSLVIADRGYPGTGPDAQPPEGGTAWIYSTGVLTARFGPVRYPERDVADQVAYATNDRVVHAERPVGISWLCAHFAINVCYR